jgi:hypothetical protein
MSINWEMADALVHQNFAALAELFKQEQIAQIEQDKWGWPNETHRRNGSVVGSPRDIVDTGELRDSLRLEPVSPTEVIYSYDCNHAIIVHQGATLKGGGKIPPRPWVDAAAAELQKHVL